MRVAFTIGKLGNWWTGGVNYFVNLISALHELPGNPVEPVLFAGHNADKSFIDRLSPFLPERPVVDAVWTPETMEYRLRLAEAVILQRDRRAEELFNYYKIDVVFQFFAWYGKRFSIPTLAWIADFQHRHLPDMFGRGQYLKRELGYNALVRCATKIQVSSEDARRDCEAFYPKSRGKIEVLPFAVRIGEDAWMESPERVIKTYNLPKSYILLPNQFWKHKNHLAVLEALRILKSRGNKVTIVATGNLRDNRDPQYTSSIINFINNYSLQEYFILLGPVPFNDVYPLMRGAVAVLNPSLFEGWSTTVEEAKSLGVPLILSDLNVHREQSPIHCLYFNPHDYHELADILIKASAKWELGPHYNFEEEARSMNSVRRANFANKFVCALQNTIACSQS